MSQAFSEQSLIASIASAALRHKMLVAVFSTIALAIGIGFLNSPPQYTVVFKVTSASNNQTAISSSVSSLASLAGVNVRRDQNELAFELYLDGLLSRRAADILAKDQALLRAMFPADWDEQNRTWRQPPSTLQPVKDFVKSLLGRPPMPWRPPDGERLQRALSQSLTISRSRLTPIVTISMQVGDPDFGKRLMLSLHNVVDDALRQKSLTKATRYINYLNRELATITVSDYRQALIDTLMDQEKLRMNASSGLAFAADPVEQPVAVPAMGLGASTVLLISLLLGAFAGIVVAWILDFFGLSVWQLWEARSQLFSLTGLRKAIRRRAETGYH